MRAFNIRQLKSNPSIALRAAHEDDMVVVMNKRGRYPFIVLRGRP